MAKHLTGPLPKYVDFGFHKVRVEIIGIARMREETDCEPEEITPTGAWQTDDDTIYILKGMNRNEQRYTLMHEMIHASLDMMDSIEKPKRR